LNQELFAALPEGTLGFALSAAVKITTDSKFVMMQLDVAVKPDTPTTSVQIAMTSELAMQILEILQQVKQAHHLHSARADEITKSDIV